MEEGLLLLWDAFHEAHRAFTPMAMRPIPLTQLIQAGLAQDEVERLTATTLLAWCDSGIAAGQPGGGRREAGGYVLTRSGATAVFQALCSGPSEHGRKLALFAVVERPVWNPEARELWWRSRLVKRFYSNAANQCAILTAFEKQGWPRRIDDPLPPNVKVNRKLRLRETIKSLNRGQKPQVLCFRSDGTGWGVRWDALQ